MKRHRPEDTSHTLIDLSREPEAKKGPIRLLLPLLLLLPLPLSEQASFMAAVADSGAQAMHSTT